MVSLLNSTPALGVPSKSTTAASKTGPDQLGKQEFLKLLIAQLRNQDPMKPMEDREFIAQLAQFSTLETMQNLDKRLEALANAQALGQAAAMIGKRVEAKLTDGTALTGLVSEVRVVSGNLQLMINGQAVPLNQVTTIGG